MIETFRTMTGFNRVDKSTWFRFRNSYNARATRSTVSVTYDGQEEGEDVIFMENVKRDTRKKFFTLTTRIANRANNANNWNKIPDEVKRQKKINAFKNSYDEWVRREQQQQQQQQP